MKKATKTEIKEEAQREIMHSIEGAFYQIYDSSEFDCENPKVAQLKKLEALRVQLRRIEKLFGYKEGSWKF